MTMAQALTRYLCAQRTEVDGEETSLVAGVFAIFGHGNVAGLGEALYAARGDLPTLRAHNEQAMAHAAVAFAKAHRRRRLLACTTSIGPGATNMVTAAAVAHVNRLPVLLLPGDVFVGRQADPVLQQVEDFGDPTITANDCLRPVCTPRDRARSRWPSARSTRKGSRNTSRWSPIPTSCCFRATSATRGRRLSGASVPTHNADAMTGEADRDARADRERSRHAALDDEQLAERRAHRVLHVASEVGGFEDGACEGDIGPVPRTEPYRLGPDGDVDHAAGEAAVWEREREAAQPEIAKPVVGPVQRALDQIGVADEVGDEAAGRLPIEVGRRPLLRDRRVVHDDDLIGHRQSFLLVVSDVHDAEAELLLELADLAAYATAELGVEIRKRLVEQQDPRLEHQGARHRDALLLAARELTRQAVVEPGEAEQGQPRPRGGDRPLARLAAGAQAVADVLEHGHVRKQRVGLEHHADVAIGGGDARDVVAPDENAPARRHLEARDQPERRRLPAAGRPEQSHQCSGGDGEGHIADSDHRAVRLGHASELDRRRATCGAHAGICSRPTVVGARRPRRRWPTTSWIRSTTTTMNAIRTEQYAMARP